MSGSLLFCWEESGGGKLADVDVFGEVAEDVEGDGAEPCRGVVDGGDDGVGAAVAFALGHGVPFVFVAFKGCAAEAHGDAVLVALQVVEGREESVGAGHHLQVGVAQRIRYVDIPTAVLLAVEGEAEVESACQG